MAYQNLILETADHIATITINHPPANAWNLATIQEFALALEFVEKDDDIRVLIITGAGEKTFSAGLDVSDGHNVAKISPLVRETWRHIDRFPKPVIAAINGYAFGGGLELAMSCHFRIMVDNQKPMVGLTELNLGIIPGWGGTQRLPRLVGRAKALDMILFSRRLTAAEALELGLANRVSAPGSLMRDTLSFARELAERPPIAVRSVLEAMAAGLYEGLDDGLKAETRGSDRVRETEDRKEGFAAFMEKRKPNFTGR
jgi:enoyl-CoA hydratase/carnithine racemase